MPRAAKTVRQLGPEDALIARALHEAANRHIDPYDKDDRFRSDADIGFEMRTLLEDRFPDFARAVDDASALQTALAYGFLPPPGGATPESVKVFLAQRETAREAKRPPPKLAHSSYIFDDSDLPF